MANSINNSQLLRDPETLESSNTNFKLGFFSPSNSKNRYLAVWYNNKDTEFGMSEVVWIANRDNPLSSSSGSFNHLTHALLAPARLAIDMHSFDQEPTLRSWKTALDPSNGRFSFGIISRNFPEAFVLDGDKLYWRSGLWNGYLFLGIPNFHSEASSGFQFIKDEQGKPEMSFTVANPTLLERIVLSYDGRLIEKDWDDCNRKWKLLWKSFESECELYGKCGAFGSCDPKNSPICSCLKGFEPKNMDEWSKGNWSSGCVRRTPLECVNAEKPDKFLRLKHMKVPDYSNWETSSNQDDCERICFLNCSCLAYAYYSGIGCMMWNSSLIDIQQFSTGGADIFVRLAHIELGNHHNLMN
ncbi:G-type lectin S-receptor-like serine/threonine-protein kinase At1g11300 [Amaranthus tricolor]|uniref:G-type lectin S-receptor-like serine/threonine-protein kinase At1g11300 n=1 Tax=Amaranthus tricolor TaxID=29722 RepID=UPI00258A425C|nr:G-type lectin S-receptor-like serine/threonine-protein kinase At1g11300 [Amaranthus tricolor]